jgi:small subunit ribosomal protein S8
MTMTDPIADMLTRLRNASAAKHETVDMPYSKFKANIAEILKREGYIKDFTAKEAKVGQTLEVTLKYGPNGERSIQGIKRISKPGLRRYAKSDSLPMPPGYRHHLDFFGTADSEGMPRPRHWRRNCRLRVVRKES